MTKKLLTIAENLGKKIIAQSVVGNKLDDPWRLEDEDMVYDPTVIHEADEDWSSTDLGFHFDGLKCGINLCITAMLYDNKLSELKATFNGYVVFCEEEGELKAYAPFPTWENAVEMFYEAALDIEKKRLLRAKEVRQTASKERMNEFWSLFRRLWGY